MRSLVCAAVLAAPLVVLQQPLALSGIERPHALSDVEGRQQPPAKPDPTIPGERPQVPPDKPAPSKTPPQGACG
jgi:hypothetical protein